MAIAAEVKTSLEAKLPGNGGQIISLFPEITHPGLIGITGSPYAGKSMIARWLVFIAEAFGLNALTVDLDLEMRQLVSFPSSEVRDLLLQKFGKKIFIDGKVNLHELGQRVFAAPARKNWFQYRLGVYLPDRVNQIIAKGQYDLVFLESSHLWGSPILADCQYRAILVTMARKDLISRMKDRPFKPEQIARRLISPPEELERKLERSVRKGGGILWRIDNGSRPSYGRLETPFLEICRQVGIETK